jgi:hypothetical protein
MDHCERMSILGDIFENNMEIMKLLLIKNKECSEWKKRAIEAESKLEKGSNDGKPNTDE